MLTSSGFQVTEVIGLRPNGCWRQMTSFLFLKSQTTVLPLLLVLAKMYENFLFHETLVTSSNFWDFEPGEYGLVGLFKSQMNNFLI